VLILRRRTAGRLDEIEATLARVVASVDELDEARLRTSMGLRAVVTGLDVMIGQPVDGEDRHMTDTAG
jgi:hypothetical protein